MYLITSLLLRDFDDWGLSGNFGLRRRDTKPHRYTIMVNVIRGIQKKSSWQLTYVDISQRHACRHELLWSSCGVDTRKSDPLRHPTALLSQRLCFWFAMSSTGVRTPPSTCTVVEKFVVTPENRYVKGVTCQDILNIEHNCRIPYIYIYMVFRPFQTLNTTLTQICLWIL